MKLRERMQAIKQDSIQALKEETQRNSDLATNSLKDEIANLNSQLKTSNTKLQ
jgi:LPS O-antigen subunit length determinant protein (WzzB/FepE family)